jgi:hypothetical protein
MKKFQQAQIDFAKYLRAPDEQPIPTGMDARRMDIYCDLIYNNIENLIAGVFPVLRSVLSDEQWHGLVRQFIKNHRCQTPYFLEISEEFLQFITQYSVLLSELPFIAELAHYEWVELALDISEAQLPALISTPNDIFAATFCVSPLAVALHYQYPVHKISPQFKTTTPDDVALVVYRNRADQVRFMTVNPLTSRLLYLMHANTGTCLGELLSVIAEELQHPHPEQLKSEAESLVKALCELDVLYLIA